MTDAWEITGADVLFHALPVFHTHGLFVACNTLMLAGGAMIFVVSHEVIPETHRNGHQTPATIGLLAGFAFLVTVPAGAWMIFQGDLRPTVAKAVPFRLPYKPAPAPVTTAVTPGQALAAGRARFCEARFVRLTLPTPKAPVYTVRLRQPGETRAWSGVTTVAIDPSTGRILDVYDPRAAPAANRAILDWAKTLR